MKIIYDIRSFRIYLLFSTIFDAIDIDIEASIGDSGFGREPNIPINHYLYLNGI